jgi:hypothetical protein
VPSSDDKDAFLKAVQRLRPKNRVLLYTYTSYWHSHNSSGYVADGLWIAHYGVPRPNINVPYRFWQYSDKPIDQNHGYFASVAALRAWASFAGSGVQPAQRPQVSLKAVQRALETATNPGKAGLGDNDGEQVQRALNHAMGAHLVVDGILGAQTRKVAAAFEVQAFGAKPGSKDADGILGKESLVRLGFDVQA